MKSDIQDLDIKHIEDLYTKYIDLIWKYIDYK